MMFYQGNKVRVNCSADEGMRKYCMLEDFVCDTHLDCGLRDVCLNNIGILAFYESKLDLVQEENK